MTSELVDRELIRDLIQRSAVLLDAERLEEWLELFDENGIYDLTAYSSEIRRWMSWWKSDRLTLQKTLKDVGRHVRDPAKRRHIVGSPVIVLQGGTAEAISHFSVYRTTPEGESTLYMVGCYVDHLVKHSERWYLARHKVIADTRVLAMFTHIPI